MRTWLRTPVATFCGYCRRPVPKGEPVLAISREKSWTLTRCEACAGEAAPALPDPPVPVPIQPTPKSARTFTRVRTLPAADLNHWKHRQAGDR